MLALQLLRVLLLLEVVLGLRIWRVELLRRCAMPQAGLLLQGRSWCSTGCGHVLGIWCRGELLAWCMTRVSVR